MLCVMPGLYIESTPVALFRDHDKPAVRTVRPEDFDTKDRTDFLVMRPQAVIGNIDIAAKIRERCLFHLDKPYHFYGLSEPKDRLFCSELVATIYKEVGINLVEGRECGETLPFDLELAVENAEVWLDVTDTYVAAEELRRLNLIMPNIIEGEKIDFRRMFVEEHDFRKKFSSALDSLAGAADDVVKEFERHQTTEIQLPKRPLTYVANLQELLGVLQKHYRNYTGFRPFEFPEPAPERLIFNAIEARSLVERLNQVQDAVEKLAKSSIAVVIGAFRSECREFLTIATHALAALKGGPQQNILEANLEQLSQLTRTADEREPEAERESGAELVQHISALIQEMETTEISPGVDPKIVDAFLLAARMLLFLARHVENLFYGSEMLNIVRIIAEANGSEQSAEMRVALAPIRQRLEKLFGDRRDVFEDATRTFQ